MLVYNTQEHLWPLAVVSIKRKLEGVFVNFRHFEFGSLQIQFAKALIEKGCKSASVGKQRGLSFVT